MKDENVIVGRGWGFGTFILLVGMIGLMLIIIGIIESQVVIVIGGLVFTAIGLSIGIYALLPKKMVFGKLDVCYFIGKKKKFELLWPEIIRLEARSSSGKYSTDFIDIHTSDKKYTLELGIAFQKKKMKQIFNRLVKGTKNNEKIEILDNLGWQFE
jgi:hypothetical protein